MSAPFRLEPLNDTHDRNQFDCGQEPLNRHLKTQATQDIRRRIAACFVAADATTNQAAAGMLFTDLPAQIARKLPRYPSIPAVRVGRLAVDEKFQRRGLGAALLADALQRALASPPAIYALLVDAKDDNAVAFYEHHGFIPLVHQPRTLFLPLANAGKIAT